MVKAIREGLAKELTLSVVVNSPSGSEVRTLSSDPNGFNCHLDRWRYDHKGSNDYKGDHAQTAGSRVSSYYGTHLLAALDCSGKIYFNVP